MQPAKSESPRTFGLASPAYTISKTPRKVGASKKLSWWERIMLAESVDVRQSREDIASQNALSQKDDEAKKVLSMVGRSHPLLWNTGNTKFGKSSRLPTGSRDMSSLCGSWNTGNMFRGSASIEREITRVPISTDKLSIDELSLKDFKAGPKHRYLSSQDNPCFRRNPANYSFPRERRNFSLPSNDVPGPGAYTGLF